MHWLGDVLQKIRQRRISLNTRIVALVTLITFAAALAITAACLAIFTRGARERIQRDHFSHVSNIASGIDQKFQSRQIILRSVARAVTDEADHSLPNLQRILRAHEELKEVFDNIAILSKTGDIVANYNDVNLVGKLNVVDRPYFTQTLYSKAGLISQPYESRVTKRPLVNLTQPVFDAHGNVELIISGGIDLQQNNFLGEFANTRFGKTGYLFILNTDGILIEHPQKSRILRHINIEGKSNPASEKALAGFEGSTEGMNRNGVFGLYAFKRLSATNWILGGIYPEAEALAAVDTLLAEALGIALFLSVLAGLGAWAIMRRQLRPLSGLHRHMLATRHATPYRPYERAHSNDEVGDIGAAFDELMQERERARRQLEHSEHHMREILAHAGDAFVSCDADGRVTEWNRQAELVFGWTRKECLGRLVAELLVPPEMRVAHNAGMELFRWSGTGPVVNQRIEVMALHRDGHKIPVELSISAVFIEGQYTANAFMRDISSRLEAAQKLATSEKRLRMIADHLPAQIAYVDAGERYLFVNVHHAQRAGLAPAEIVGRTMREVRGEQLYAFFSTFIPRVMAGETVTFQGTSIRDGQLYYYESTFVPATDANDTINGFYTMTFDITERIKVDTMKNEFISTVSHELRTPLTSINGALGLIISGVLGAIPDKVQQMLKIAHRNGERLIRLVNDMLDVEKIESGKMVFVLQPLALHPLLAAALESTRGFARQYRVQVQLGADEATVCAQVDPDRFMQVMVNLLSNAIKFSQREGEVEVLVSRSGGNAIVSVTDHGLGISEGDRDKIFQKFSQVDGSASRKTGGTGLGLHICKAIVEQMAGTIHFTSAVGQGTSFIVTLPLA